MDKEKIQRFENHIQALETSYGNFINILNQEVETGEDGNIKLKDTQKRIFTEGTMSTAKAADEILEMINRRKIQLKSLKEGIDLDTKDENGEEKIPVKKEEVKDENPKHPLAGHLN